MDQEKEQRRLAALKALGLLDTDPEAEYDAITDLVTAVTGSKMAAVSLVDADRQWFKSAVNLPARETPRDVAFCHHAIQQDEIYEIPDACEDALFAENPLVTGEPHIRGYAGVPLRLSTGEKIGTLCAIHDEPLELDDVTRKRLRALAHTVENLIHERSVAREQYRLAMVARHTNNAVIITNRAGRVTWVNPAFEAISGYTFDEAIGQKPGDLLQCDASQQKAITAMAEAVRNASACEVEIVNRSKTGEQYTVYIELMPIREDGGECTGFMAVETDISERLATQERLSSSLQETQDLMGAIRENAIFSQTDREGVILDVNEAFCEISGYASNELVGLTHAVVNSDTHDAAFWSSMWQTISSGRAWRGEICNRKKSGELYWVDSIIAPLLDARGEIEKFISIRFDITERKQADAELRESELGRKRVYDRLAAVTELGGIGSWEVDLTQDAPQPYWDAITKQIHEVEPDFQPDLATAINFYAPEARPIVEAAVQQGIDNGEPWGFELPLITGKNNRIWVRAVGRALYENGEVVKLLGSFQDISERRSRQDELTTISTRLEVALGASGIGVWEHDIAANTQYWDKNTYRLFGRDEALEPPDLEEWLVAVEEEDRDRLQREIERALAERDRYFCEYKFIRPDGECRYIRAHGLFRERLDGGAIFTGVNLDVTDDVRRAEELENQRAEADRANEAKSQFIANMSHEIRTPLNGVMGMAQLLMRTQLDETQTRHVGTLKTSGQALLDLIEDILDISKIEAGMVDVDREDFDVTQMVTSVSDMVSSLARGKGLDVSTAIDPEVITWVSGDKKAIRQVLINIVGNAVKFTEEGSVSIAVRPFGDDQVEFAVTDTGPGIPADQLDRIFDRFAQVDNSKTRKHGGTGLGLAICRELIQLNGGEVGVDSEYGQGTTFWFRLPLPAAQSRRDEQETPVVEQDKEASRTGRILVVDDIQTNQIVAAALVRNAGHAVELAGNGEEAIEALEHDTFDLVLMDIQMPVMSGDEAIRRIRASGKSYADIPIFALTADASKGAEETYLALGANGYMSKPLDLDRVTRAIEKAFEESRLKDNAA